MGPRDFRPLALALLISACGDDDTAPTGTDAGTDARAVTPPAPTTPSTPTGGPAGPTPIPVDCPLGTTVEVEPNDTPAQANKLVDLAFCGSLSPGSDADYTRFDTPAGKKLSLFQAVVEGNVDFDLVVNGKTLKPTQVKTFEAGSYVVKAYTTDAKPAKYRFRIQYEN